MSDGTIFSKTFTVNAGDLKRAFAEEREFKATRRGMLGPLTYMAHADGWVMARPKDDRPVVIAEADWRALPTA